MVGLRATAASLLALAALCGSVSAHPGEHRNAAKLKRSVEIARRADENADQIIARCQHTNIAKAMKERAVLRRAAKAREMREQRGLEESRMIVRRDQEDLDQWMQTCHNQGDKHQYDKSTPIHTIFGSNVTTGLAPETIIGPYWVEGEFIRTNIFEKQDGIPIHLDLQFVDVASCAAVPNMLVDVWHANATGVYSGVTSGGGLNSTFSRGVQITDIDGVVQFDSVFPGHYLGRTNHIHVTSNRGATLLENGTYIGGKVNHIGQLYFDQELASMIETMPPYSNNMMKLTTNAQDFLTAQQSSREYDPFLDYVLLSENPADGILMWITIGVNTTADQSHLVSAASHYYKEGGKENPSPWGNISFPGNFTFPAGGFPGGGFPTALPPGFTPPPGMPPFPTASGPTPTPTKFWGPCMKKRE
ncbi:hypothetical protein JX265_000279 [Neoarthrinium moseri]|uniref:Intradiol ring-cleavage dioxygenases domain-containing protein n=1 Tax=Neoarthrinium moseri TaxID=1658444 RepID=A0A9P9WY66_9PEZI|nr:hypothetical protein JX265_000279 [Neoarthrinium moseri]